MLRLAVGAIVSFSTLPLRLFYWVGVVATVPFAVYALFALVKWYRYGVAWPGGWMALQMSIITFGCLTLVCLGIMGEYIGRIYEQSKNRPLFLIRDRTEGDDFHARRAPSS
jgi:dolichol-phosphate mannosyltransferase